MTGGAHEYSPGLVCPAGWPLSLFGF